MQFKVLRQNASEEEELSSTFKVLLAALRTKLTSDRSTGEKNKVQLRTYGEAMDLGSKDSQGRSETSKEKGSNSQDYEKSRCLIRGHTERCGTERF